MPHFDTYGPVRRQPDRHWGWKAATLSRCAGLAFGAGSRSTLLARLVGNRAGNHRRSLVTRGATHTFPSVAVELNLSKLFNEQAPRARLLGADWEPPSDFVRPAWQAAGLRLQLCSGDRGRERPRSAAATLPETGRTARCTHTYTCGTDTHLTSYVYARTYRLTAGKLLARRQGRSETYSEFGSGCESSSRARLGGMESQAAASRGAEGRRARRSPARWAPFVTPPRLFRSSDKPGL